MVLWALRHFISYRSESKQKTTMSSQSNPNIETGQIGGCSKYRIRECWYFKVLALFYCWRTDSQNIIFVTISYQVLRDAREVTLWSAATNRIWTMMLSWTLQHWQLGNPSAMETSSKLVCAGHVMSKSLRVQRPDWSNWRDKSERFPWTWKTLKHVSIDLMKQCS